MAELSIYHQNLHKSLLPIQELQINAGLDNLQHTKVLCLQELNTRHNSVTGFGNKLYTYSNDTNDQRIRVAILTNFNSTLKVVQHCSSDCVVIFIPFYGLEIFICTVIYTPIQYAILIMY